MQVALRCWFPLKCAARVRGVLITMTNDNAAIKSASGCSKTCTPIVLAQMILAVLISVGASVCLILKLWIPGFALLVLATVLSLFPYSPKVR